MAIVKKTVVREGYESIYETAKAKLAVIEDEAKFKFENDEEVIAAKQVLADKQAAINMAVAEDKNILEGIIAASTIEIEEEIPDEEEVTEQPEIVENGVDGIAV